jgi:creatinine amidohydrolase/Fe(II)-dependent formamide hydrolase-like protein
MGSSVSTPFYAPTLTYLDIERHLSLKPIVILPLVRYHPLGPWASTGAHGLCDFAIAEYVSRQTGVLLAAPMNWNFGTPLRSFGGCGGMSCDATDSALMGLFNSFAVVGAQKIFVIGETNERSQLSKKTKNRENIHFFDWRRNAAIKKNAVDTLETTLFWDDAAVCAMTSFLDSSQVYSEAKRAEFHDSYVDDFRRWQRRGKDPDKFRNLFPHGSVIHSEKAFDAQIGKNIYEQIAEQFEKLIEEHWALLSDQSPETTS